MSQSSLFIFCLGAWFRHQSRCCTVSDGQIEGSYEGGLQYNRKHLSNDQTILYSHYLWQRVKKRTSRFTSCTRQKFLATLAQKSSYILPSSCPYSFASQILLYSFYFYFVAVKFGKINSNKSWVNFISANIVSFPLRMIFFENK